MEPNVLLVVLDSVRAANVSAEGYPEQTTPTLDRLAEGATRYTQARSPGSWSLPSHASLFTGLHVAEHRVTEPSHRLTPGHTVFEDLRAAGYDTGVFSENPWLTTMDVGLDAGFDTVAGAQNVLFPEGANPVEFTARAGQGEYREFLRFCLAHDHPVKSLANGVANKLAWDYPALVPDSLTASAPASAYADRFLDWQADRDGPWAACLNLMDAHAPYEPLAEHDRWSDPLLRKAQRDLEKHVWSFHAGDAPWWLCRAFEALYDGTVRQADAAVGDLLAALDERGDLEDTLVVVTADHGEAFGEVDRLKGTRLAGHVEGVHERQLHVPLVVKRPGQTDGEVVRDPASLTNFPGVVRAVREDGATTAADATATFADGPVVASSHGLTEPNMRLAEQYCDADALWQFRGDMQVVYEASDGGENAVEKYATWDEEAVSIRVVDAETSYVREPDDGGRVAAAFEDLDDAGVREQGTDIEDVDDATHQRLRDLGYAE
jgi:arylsulfatase A-like enzyme